MIALAQFFGIFPVVSIFNSDISKIKFKILSIRTLVSILWIASAIAFLYLELARLLKYEAINAKSISGLVFFIVGTTTGILFFRLALKWNELLKVFKTTEDTLQSYSLPGWSLDKRMKIASAVLLTAAVCGEIFILIIIAWVTYLFTVIWACDGVIFLFIWSIRSSSNLQMANSQLVLLLHKFASNACLQSVSGHMVRN